MAKLNLERAIKRGYEIINIRYSMRYNSMLALMNRPDNFGKVCDTFALGYYQGYKAAKAEARKAVRA